MDQWYYAKDGQQHGPITLGELQGLLRSGALNPTGDLVWNPSMTDWLPAVQVPALNGGAANAPVSGEAHGSHPFAYPTASGAVEEIPIASEPIIPTACVKRAFDLTVKHIGPILLITVIFVVLSIIVSVTGSEPIIPTACVKRAFDLTIRHLGAMIGITLLYFIVSWLVGEMLGLADEALGMSPGRDMPAEIPIGTDPWEAFKQEYAKESMSIPMTIVSYIVMVFFMLGFTKIGLNVVSGKPFGVGMLFGGGKWLMHGFIGYVLYSLMIIVGMALFIFPGFYLMFRFGMYQNAIVDRNLNAIEAFRYSSQITANNKVNLFVLFLFAILVMTAGCVALFVGILFAYPVIWLSWIVAYRWMQYGGRAVLDDPATGQPLLSAAPE